MTDKQEEFYEAITESEKHDPDVEAIWQELWPWIASEDPPDSGDSEADLIALCEGPLPRIWSRVLALEAKLERYERRENGEEFCEAHQDWLPIEEMHMDSEGTWLCQEAWEELVASQS